MPVEIWRFSQENLRLLKEHIIQNEAAALGFEHNGAYSLAAQPNEFEELKSVAATMEKLSIRTEVLESGAVATRVGAQNFIGGIKYLDDASINPVNLVNKVRSMVKADIFEGVEARAIIAEGSSRILKTDGGDFETSMVVLNLNGYSTQLHPWFADKIIPHVRSAS